MFVVKPGLVAFVRLVEGGTVKLYAGDTVPAEADQAHVELLVSQGVLTEAEDPKPEARRAKSGSGNN